MNWRPSIAVLIVLASGVLRAEESPRARETSDQVQRRHVRVAERRQKVHLICHRGAVDFAHENTLEAYRTAFELGADGNEIDIRATKDGVLVCFHDDMLDNLLDAYGDVADYSWAELERFPFRQPGRFGKHCRIPTLREVFKLHRDFRGLLFLDVKRPGLVPSICQLLDEYDLWDHVVQAPPDFTDPRIRRTRHKAEMYLQRTEVDDEAIAKNLQNTGERILLEFPQRVALALGRTIGPISDRPVGDRIAVWAQQPVRPESNESAADLLAVLNDADDWNLVAPEGSEAQSAAARILKRAQSADELARRRLKLPEILAGLERRVRQRSLHRDWRYCGLDGGAALRALIALQAPQSIELARFGLWRDDPEVEKAMNPMYKTPRSWTDFRTKLRIFEMLESLPGAVTEQLCRDYLALSDSDAHRIGVPQFESAAKCLIAVSPHDSTLRELLAHRLSVVRGRTKIVMLINK